MNVYAEFALQLHNARREELIARRQRRQARRAARGRR